ncbi:MULTISPECIES: deoxyribose-phosphate aldolase [unclassified Pseudoclavibacter]|uniref:deoxyribose-phosphate aldolase n=1 Tax=unclassified Pseudoclavibacter TaxID=2615177 RepID=UPI000CE8EDEA|nr:MULTISPECIES: deoxyribose-phosphate aldolase [unclassified Pseudoclavibacter]MBF4550611.1 deoxyribose-phosphate aldolase [Pseudoclavibacter sp. VKM Ac-2888]PPG05564.1 deoxyribose-phosphate aldolase [Pseudoclavibacter sp. RFBI5]
MAEVNEQSHPDDRVTRAELAGIVDHTLLKTDATPGQVAALLEEAKALKAFSICVSPNMLPVQGDPGEVKIATVVGFPSGKHHSAIKAAEAARAVADGADELDMVIDIGMLKAGRADLVQADVAAVREAAPSALLKVIIESAALTDDEIVAACQASEAAGADYVKTSTGFSAAGGASTHAVALMRATVGERLGVKASGGIRSTADALAMVEAGASRLGLSGTAAVLDGLGG